MAAPALSHWAHLARRFVGALSARPPDPEAEAWALARLLPGEAALWRRLPAADRRHAIGVARRADELLDGADREVLAAALLHDSGKLDSGLGTFGRVAATLVGMARGRDRVGGRFGAYLRHDTLGAERLAAAGSHPLTVTWAREHHRPPQHWSLDRRVAAALKAADDD